jgi:hypothetical protein
MKSMMKIQKVQLARLTFTARLNIRDCGSKMELRARQISSSSPTF